MGVVVEDWKSKLSLDAQVYGTFKSVMLSPML